MTLSRVDVDTDIEIIIDGDKVTIRTSLIKERLENLFWTRQSWILKKLTAENGAFLKST